MQLHLTALAAVKAKSGHAYYSRIREMLAAWQVREGASPQGLEIDVSTSGSV